MINNEIYSLVTTGLKVELEFLHASIKLLQGDSSYALLIINDLQESEQGMAFRYNCIKSERR